MGAVSAVDGFQRRHRVLGFPIAVVYKYFDDQGPYLAAILTLWSMGYYLKQAWPQLRNGGR